jgi:hypothetical protein
MPTGRKRIPPATRRRALELIAWSPDGMTEAMLLAHGFTVEMLVELVRAGGVARVKITEAGRRALRGKRTQ